MSYIGTNKVGKMYLGSTAIGKAYLGEDLVFDASGSGSTITFIESIDSTKPITFNTGVAITSSHTWEVDSIANKYSGWNLWVRCWDSSTAWRTSDSFIIQRNGTNDTFYLFVGNLSGGLQVLFTPPSTRCLQGYDGTKYYCDNYTKNFTAKNYNPNWPLRVSSQHIYGVKIWQNGTLVNNFRPAMKYNEETEVNDTGMYDTVTSNFIKLL